MKHFTEASLEELFCQLLASQHYTHHLGDTLTRSPEEVLIEDDLRTYLLRRYKVQEMTVFEADSIIRQLKALPASDLYESNKTIMRQLADGFTFTREDRRQKDIFVELIDYCNLSQQHKADPATTYSADQNIYKFVTQLEIIGTERRIPDGILYINGQIGRAHV